MPRIKRNCSNFNVDFNANNSNFNIDFSKKESKFGSAIEKNTEILINKLESRVVPRRLDDFETIDGEDIKDDSYLYVDNNGTDSKISVTSIANAIDYEKLKNIPSIEGVKLIGNKNFPDFGLDNIDYDYIASLE